jgi:hypothetical protein
MYDSRLSSVESEKTQCGKRQARLFLLGLRLLLLLGDLLGRLWRRLGDGSALHILGLSKSFGCQLFKLCGGRKSSFAALERQRE